MRIAATNDFRTGRLSRNDRNRLDLGPSSVAARSRKRNARTRIEPAPPSLIRALLRVPCETARERILAGLHERGFAALVAAQADVWRYPAARASDP